MQKKSVDYVSRQLPLQGLDLDSEYHSQESTQSEQLGPKPTDLMSMGRINQAIGLAGEDLVRYVLHRWRYEVFEPCNPNNKCDFVVKSGSRWTTIQVKTTEEGNRIILKRELAEKIVSGTNRNTRNYNSYSLEDFELLFIVKFPKIYIVPHKIIEKQGLKIEDYEDFSYDLNDPETYNNPPNL